MSNNVHKPAAFTIAAWLLGVHAGASNFTNLYSLGLGLNDGSNPQATLATSGKALYGTTFSGGSGGVGTVFAAGTNGSGFTNLYSFSALSASSTNADGAGPQAGLVLSGSALFGTTSAGGAGGNGAVFEVLTNGAGFTNLYSFTPPIGSAGTNIDGSGPQAGLVLSGSALFGTAGGGGGSGNGTVFRLNADGTGFTNLHSFSSAGFNSAGAYTNGDGANPSAGLVLFGNTLYGTTKSGGNGGAGTIFALGANGTGFTNLYTFSALSPALTNSDGANAQAALVLSGDTLYGTTVNGGAAGNGTVFAIRTNGAGFAMLHSFSSLGSAHTNSDGANPSAALLVSGQVLRGTAYLGGSSGNGTVFRLATNGTGFATIYDFSQTGGAAGTNSDGANPGAGLLSLGGALYGAAAQGGGYGRGTLFVLNSPAPIPLSVRLLNRAVVLSWNNAAFSLQSASSLDGTFTNIPGASSPYTNATAGPPRFFRLQAQ